MSGDVIQFHRQLQRAWHLVEITPSKWRGELHERGRGLVRHTEVGPYHLVRNTIMSRNDGLPIRCKRLRSDDGPTAA